jgi:hypothetical protein
LAIVIVVAVLDKVMAGVPFWIYVAVMLATNVIIILITLQILRMRAKSERIRVAEPSPIATPSQPPSISTPSS